MELEPERTVRERYAAFLHELSEVAGQFGRTSSEVTILAVTKAQPTEAIAAAIDLGLRDIGENYLQEARRKFAALRTGMTRFRKHFLGHVQTNKAKAIVEEFDMVQSVDRIDAGRALAKAARESGKQLPVLIQLNISPTQRFGARPDEAEGLADALRADGLAVEGVMAIGPVTDDAGELSRAFEQAAKTFGRVGGSTLSLGMSADWRQAVESGSTMVRIGSALFGARDRAGEVNV